MNSISRLVDLGSPPLGRPLRVPSKVPEIIRPLIVSKNGFYAFESALHVLPWGDIESGAELWNSRDLWIKDYGVDVSGLLFFAEDAFGFQFAVGEDGIYSFD